MLALGLVGCAYLEGGATPIASPPPSAPAVSPSAAAVPESVVVTWPESEKVLGEISSARGTEQIGPVPSNAGRVVIYVKCYGTGTVSVELVGTAVIDQKCLTDADDPGTRNRIEVNAPGEVLVRGSADNSNLWAIAVTDGEEAG